MVPAGVTHIGFVGINLEGQYFIAKPKKPLYGVTATFPKTRVQPHETAGRALTRCIGEVLDEPDSLYPLHNNNPYPVDDTWVTPNSRSYYFLALFESPRSPIVSANFDYHWFTPHLAAQQFQKSPSMASRQRDSAVLASVQTQCASPYRRILLMLQELHRMGFEKLRAPAYDYPLGWRCPIIPAAWTHKNQMGIFDRKPSHHGGTFEDPEFGDLLETEVHSLRYTYYGASKQQPFGWQDMVFATPLELAARFLQAFPEIAVCGWGPDLEYAQWFGRMLEMTYPHGVITAFYADEYGAYPDKGISDVLHTHFTAVESVPLPPEGFADPGAFYELKQRLQRQTR
jgi:hypothetical protein